MSFKGSIITLSHTTSPSRYIRIAIGEVIMRYKWSLTLPLSAVFLTMICAWALTGDIRYALVALMMLLIMIPGVMALAYFSVALTYEATHSILPRHLVIVAGQSITVVYEPFKHGEETINPRKPMVIAWQNINHVKRCGDSTLIRFNGYHQLLIPDSALPCSPYSIFPYEAEY